MAHESLLSSSTSRPAHTEVRKATHLCFDVDGSCMLRLVCKAAFIDIQTYLGERSPHPTLDVRCEGLESDAFAERLVRECARWPIDLDSGERQRGRWQKESKRERTMHARHVQVLARPKRSSTEARR